MANVTNDKPAADSPEVRLSVLSDVAERAAEMLRKEAEQQDTRWARNDLMLMAERLVKATLHPAQFPVTGTRVRRDDRTGTVTSVTRLRGANLVEVKWDDDGGLPAAFRNTSHRGETLDWNNKAGLPKPGVPSPESTAKTVNRTGSFPALKMGHRRSGS